MTAPFRCATASLGQGRPAGRHRLDGPCLPAGRTSRAVGCGRAARQPAPRRRRHRLAAVARSAKVRVLFIRRHGRRADRRRGRGCSRRTPTRPRPGPRPRCSPAPAEVLDLDLAALGAGRSPGLTPYDDSLLCVCTHGRHDAVLRRARPPGGVGGGRCPSRPGLGGLAHRGRPVRGEPAGAAARALLRRARPADRGAGQRQPPDRPARPGPPAGPLRAVRCPSRPPSWRCVDSWARPARAWSASWTARPEVRSRWRGSRSPAPSGTSRSSHGHDEQGERLTCGVDRLSRIPRHEVLRVRRS